MFCRGFWASLPANDVPLSRELWSACGRSPRLGWYLFLRSAAGKPHGYVLLHHTHTHKEGGWQRTTANIAVITPPSNQLLQQSRPRFNLLSVYSVLFQTLPLAQPNIYTTFLSNYLFASEFWEEFTARTIVCLKVEFLCITERMK